MKTKIFLFICLVVSSAYIPARAAIFNFGSSKYTAHLIPFTTFEEERKSILDNLPCNWVSMPHVNQRYDSDFDFLCKGGTWATVSYMLKRSPKDPKGIQSAKLLWREWHPHAHPSGGEAYVVQPFLMQMIYRFVPVNLSSEIENAFWQEDDKEWMTDSLAIRYSYEFKQDHALRKLEVIGLKPSFDDNMQRFKMQPRKAVPLSDSFGYVEHNNSSLKDVVIPQQPIPAYQGDNDNRVQNSTIDGNLQTGPSFMREKTERSIDYQPKVPSNIDNLTPVETPRVNHDVEKQTTDMEKSVKTSVSKGSVVPPYQRLIPQPVSTQTQDYGYRSPYNKPQTGLPMLEKSPLLPSDDSSMGSVFIPEPPSVFFPGGHESLKSNALLDKADQVLKQETFSPSHKETGSSLKNNLLNDYYKAESKTEKYTERAEEKVAPLTHEEELVE